MYIYIYIRKSETQKRSEGNSRRTQIYFVSAHLHDVPFFKNS